MMAFVNGTSEGCDIRCVVFSSVYCKNVGKFDTHTNEYITLRGKKDNKGAFIVSRVVTDTTFVPPTSRLLQDDVIDDRFEGVV
jgi:hypothetical protein